MDEIDTNEIDTNEIDTNEIDTNEIDTNEIDTNEIDTLTKIIYLLKIEYIIDTSSNDINGMLIPREVLLDDETYDKIKINIPNIKPYFSSSYMTSLQSHAYSQQRWPLLNLVRQVLRSCGYKLIPKRVCDGYTIDGKKKYKRMFIVEKMKIHTNTNKKINLNI
jgi:hypothetical protein